MLSAETEATYQVQLPEFEGPLDLLLHLVKRHELNIIDVPISFITGKYLEYLDLMRSLNVDIASEYLLMASTLAYLKSRELLPPEADGESAEPDEEIGDSRVQLIQRLLEYQRYKEVAEQLSQRPTLGRTVFERGTPAEKVDKRDSPLAEVGVFELLTALSEVMQRSRVKMSYDVVIDRISITDRINEIVDLIDRQRTVSLQDCFTPSQSAAQTRHELIVTFLAMLEMARLRILRVLQEVGDGTIYLTRSAASISAGPTPDATATRDIPHPETATSDDD
jgi:segregation and condensation protein A